MHSRPHFSSFCNVIGQEYNAYNNETAPGKLRPNPERNTEKDKIQTHLQALKLILDYYHNNKQFSSGLYADCL